MTNRQETNIEIDDQWISLPLTQLTNLMDFISEVSTLYKVEPGPEFRLMTSNSTAQKLGAGPLHGYGKLLRNLLPPDYYANVTLPMLERVIRDQQPCRFSSQPPFDDSGEILDQLLTPIIENGECTHVWVITKNRYSEETLEYLAFHDSLTGLANRRFLHQRMMKSISRNHQHGIKFIVMILDRDNFKNLNDTMGHDFGDQLLRYLALSLNECIRETGMVSRLGGDEFVILLDNCDSVEIALEIAERIQTRLGEPW